MTSSLLTSLFFYLNLSVNTITVYCVCIVAASPHLHNYMCYDTEKENRKVKGLLGFSSPFVDDSIENGYLMTRQPGFAMRLCKH